MSQQDAEYAVALEKLEAALDKSESRVAELTATVETLEVALDTSEALNLNLRHDAYLGRRTARILWGMLTIRQREDARRELVLPWWVTDDSGAWAQL